MNKTLIICLIVLVTFTAVKATSLIDVKQQYTDKELLITPDFELELSEEIKEAINSGIVITFVSQVRLMDDVDWWFDSSVSSKIQTFKLRYFSLSRQYQLNNIGLKNIQNFVTLELLLHHLGSKTEFRFQRPTHADYIESRLFLDKQALPSTMQLPVVFDQDWNVNSNWQRSEIQSPSGTDSP